MASTETKPTEPRKPTAPRLRGSRATSTASSGRTPRLPRPTCVASTSRPPSASCARDDKPSPAWYRSTSSDRPPWTGRTGELEWWSARPGPRPGAQVRAPVGRPGGSVAVLHRPARRGSGAPGPGRAPRAIARHAPVAGRTPGMGRENLRPAGRVRGDGTAARRRRSVVRFGGGRRGKGVPTVQAARRQRSARTRRGRPPAATECHEQLAAVADDAVVLRLGLRCPAGGSRP